MGFLFTSPKKNSFLGPKRLLYIEANTEWVELPLARTNFHGPKPV